MMTVSTRRKEPHLHKEEVCGTYGDWYNAGYVATIMLIISGIILFTATILQVRSTQDTTLDYPILPQVAEAYSSPCRFCLELLLFERNQSEWGQGLWLAIIASICGIVAAGVEYHNLDRPPMRAHG